jgi:hypothetical protein
MALDPELLQQARTAGARLDEAERQALLSRAEYHTAIRRLHLAGGSLRAIAETLSISHQRVQQIVSGAGGSWWRRIWRTRTIRPDAVCTWCSRPPGEVSELIAGPAVYICDSCVEAAERVVTSGRPATGPFAHVKKRSVALRCAFCGKRAHQDRSLVTAPRGHICTDCLRVCREILDGRSA